MAEQITVWRCPECGEAAVWEFVLGRGDARDVWCAAEPVPYLPASEVRELVRELTLAVQEWESARYATIVPWDELRERIVEVDRVFVERFHAALASLPEGVGEK